MDDIDGYFAILELTPAATEEDVRRAYRDLVMVWHPDRFAHNPELKDKAARRMAQLSEAYAALREHFRAQPQSPTAPTAPDENAKRSAKSDEPEHETPPSRSQKCAFCNRTFGPDEAIYERDHKPACRTCKLDDYAANVVDRQAGKRGMFQTIGSGFAFGAAVTIGIIVKLGFGHVTVSTNGIAQLLGYMLVAVFIGLLGGGLAAWLPRLAGLHARWILRATFCLGAAAFYAILAIQSSPGSAPQSGIVTSHDAVELNLPRTTKQGTGFVGPENDRDQAKPLTDADMGFPAPSQKGDIFDRIVAEQLSSTPAPVPVEPPSFEELASGATHIPTPTPFVAPARTASVSVDEENRIQAAQRIKALGVRVDHNKFTWSQVMDMENRIQASQRIKALGVQVDYTKYTWSQLMDMENRIQASQRIKALGVQVDYRQYTWSQLMEMERRIEAQRR